MLPIKKKKKRDLGGRLKVQHRKLKAKGYKPGRFLKPSWSLQGCQPLGGFTSGLPTFERLATL
jgi:hypothetical protein